MNRPALFLNDQWQKWGPGTRNRTSTSHGLDAGVGGEVVTPLLFVAISATQGVLPRASGAQTAEFIETFCIGEDGLTSPIITPPPGSTNLTLTYEQPPGEKNEKLPGTISWAANNPKNGFLAILFETDHHYQKCHF